MTTATEQFADALHRHQARVYSIALRIVGESGAAEEVAQDVFLALHRSLPRLESEQHVLAWLRRVHLPSRHRCPASPGRARRRNLERTW